MCVLGVLLNKTLLEKAKLITPLAVILPGGWGECLFWPLKRWNQPTDSNEKSKSFFSLGIFLRFDVYTTTRSFLVSGLNHLACS